MTAATIPRLPPSYRVDQQITVTTAKVPRLPAYYRDYRRITAITEKFPSLPPPFVTASTNTEVSHYRTSFTIKLPPFF